MTLVEICKTKSDAELVDILEAAPDYSIEMMEIATAEFKTRNIAKEVVLETAKITYQKRLRKLIKNTSFMTVELDLPKSTFLTKGQIMKIFRNELSGWKAHQSTTADGAKRFRPGPKK